MCLFKSARGAWDRIFISLACVSITLCGVSLVSKSAEANTLSAIGGLGFGRNTGMNDVKSPNPLLGAEYMLELNSAFEVGGAYLENFLSYNTGESGSIRSGGLVGRFHVLGSRVGPFVDAGIGLAWRTQGDNSSGRRFSYGGGVGFEVPIGFRLSMSPHVFMRMLPDSVSDLSSHPVVNGALMFSIRL